MKKLLVLFATGFGLGYSPVASGTVGTVLGIPLVLALWTCPHLIGQVVGAVLLALFSVLVCQAGEDHFKTKDDGRIVADEYLTFPICMLGLPAEPWVLAMAFLTARFFDIVKPPPAFQLQKLKGGFGITIDDVVASLYSLAVNHLIYWLVVRYF